MDLHREPKPFFRGQIVAEDGSQMVWFANEDVNRFFAAKDDLKLHMDGTFQAMPKMGLAQLFIIHAQHEGTLFPLAYFLMTSHTKKAYLAAFRGWASVFGAIHPSSVMADYEDSLRAAVREMWPSAAIRGCWFHFAQAIFRMAKKLGVSLVPADMNLVMMAMTLPLLPQAKVAEGMQFVQSQMSGASGKKFGLYLKEQWGQKNISVFGFEARTNNLAESFHRNLMRHIKVAHPGVWAFVDHLRTVGHNKAMDLLRYNRGISTAPSKSLHNAVKDNKIAEAQSRIQLDGDVVALMTEMRSVMARVFTRQVPGTERDPTDAQQLMQPSVAGEEKYDAEYLEEDAEETAATQAATVVGSGMAVATKRKRPPAGAADQATPYVVKRKRGGAAAPIIGSGTITTPKRKRPLGRLAQAMAAEASGLPAPQEDIEVEGADDAQQVVQSSVADAKSDGEEVYPAEYLDSDFEYEV